MKTLVLLCLFSSSCFIVKAQLAKYELGIIAGANTSTAYGGNVQRTDNLVAGGAGVFIKIDTKKPAAFKLSLSYDHSGWIYRDYTIDNAPTTPLAKADFLVKLGYLNLSPQAEFGFGKSVKVYIDCGGFIGFLLSDKLVTKRTDPGTGGNTVSNSTARRFLNFGLSAGTGVRLPINSRVNFLIDVHDNFGIANVQKYPNSNDDAAMRTNMLSFSAGLSFGL